MKKTVFTFLSLIVCLAANAQSGTAKEEKPAVKRSFDVMDIQKELHKNKKKYDQFLTTSTLKCGVYYLKKDDVDKQSPHDEDEVYYVAQGKGQIKVGDEIIDVKEGSVVFVEANKDHKFMKITEDLVLMVFFSMAKPTEVVADK